MKLLSETHGVYQAVKELFYITPEILDYCNDYCNDYSELLSAIMETIFSILDNPPPTLTSITTLSLIEYIQKLQLKIHNSNDDYLLKMERYRFIEYFTSTNDSELGLTMQVISFLSHAKTGSITIMLEDNDCNEELSAKTINSIPISNIKFPYKSYAIDTSMYKLKIAGKFFDSIFYYNF